MAQFIQLDFFKTEEESKIDCLYEEFEKVKDSSTKVRKSLFARNGELTKQYNELNDRLSIIERNICKGI